MQPSELERGRQAYAERAWADAFAALSAAGELDRHDIELRARAAYVLGLDDDYVGALEQAHPVEWSSSTSTPCELASAADAAPLRGAERRGVGGGALPPRWPVRRVLR